MISLKILQVQARDRHGRPRVRGEPVLDPGGLLHVPASRAGASPGAPRGHGEDVHREAVLRGQVQAARGRAGHRAAGGAGVPGHRRGGGAAQDRPGDEHKSGGEGFFSFGNCFCTNSSVVTSKLEVPTYNVAGFKIIIVAYSKAVACVAASTAAVVAVAITSLGVSGTSTTKMFSLSQNVLPCYQESGIKFIFNTSHSFPDRAPSRLPPLGAWQHRGPANHLLPHQPGRLGRPEGNVLQEEAQVNLVSHIETSKFKFI